MITLLLVPYFVGVVLLSGAVFIMFAGFPSNDGDEWLMVKTALWVALWPVAIPFGMLVNLIRGR